MTKPAFRARIKTLTITVCVTALGMAYAQTLPREHEDQRLDPRPDRAERVGLPAIGSPVELAPRPAPEPASRKEPAATVHLASYYERGDAERGWRILQADYPDILSGHEPILREIDLGARGRFVRLLAGPLEGQEEAASLCRALRQEGAYCAPADATGEFLFSRKDWNS